MKSKYILLVLFFLLGCDKVRKTNKKYMVLSPAYMYILSYLDNGWVKENVSCVDQYTLKFFPIFCNVASAFAPNYEAIISHNPKTIFIQGINTKLKRWTQLQKINLISISIEKLSDIVAQMKRATIIINTKKAKFRLEKWLLQLRKITSKSSSSSKISKNYFPIICQKNNRKARFLTAGNNTFINDIFLLFGLNENKRKINGWGYKSYENILAQDYRAIVYLCSNDAENYSEYKFLKKNFVKIIGVSGKHLLMPGANILKSIEKINKAIGVKDKND